MILAKVKEKNGCEIWVSVCLYVCVRLPARGSGLGQKRPLHAGCLRVRVQEIGFGHYSCAGIA